MVQHLIAHRFRRAAPATVGAAVVLGLVLGLALASFAAARDTASSYGRVLAAADAETAVIAHLIPPDDAAAILDAQPAIARHRYQGGFLAYVEGIEPALTGGVIASASDGFAFELPTLREGRLPDPDRADEVFVNEVLADSAGLGVGDEVILGVVSVETDEVRRVPVTITGIGIFPREAVADETALTGIVSPTRAFREANEDLQLYSNSRVWLDDASDLPDLTQALAAEGMFVSETRAQERRGVEDALGPTVTVLAALGVLASVGTVLVAVQVAQRRQERWRADDEVITALGGTSVGRAAVHLASVAAEAVLAAGVAVGVMLAAAPLAPVGPLHDLDPRQGVHLDLTVAGVGAAALAAVLTLVTLALVLGPRSGSSPAREAGPLTGAARRATSLAGLSVALRSRRRAGLRLALASAAGAALLAGVATVVESSRAMIDDPERYGVDFELLAINAFGEQTEAGVARAFEVPEVVDAASFTSAAMLVEGQIVPGLGVSTLRGEAGPTILEGGELRHDDEIVLGVDTAERLGADVGDELEVQATSTLTAAPPPPGRTLRVVGLATFAPISQQGTDEARLGVGAMVTDDTLDDLLGQANLPEWTVATLADGASPAELEAANPDGVEDALGIPTRWFTSARPAELLQLEAADGVLGGAVGVAFLLLAVLVVQGAWSRSRASTADLAVLQALGYERRQLGRTAAWHAVPPGAAALLLGLPIGVAGGRLTFSAFAQSIAVVDDPSSPLWLVAALVLAVAASAGAGALVAALVARRVSGARALRDATDRRA